MGSWEVLCVALVFIGSLIALRFETGSWFDAGLHLLMLAGLIASVLLLSITAWQYVGSL